MNPEQDPNDPIAYAARDPEANVDEHALLVNHAQWMLAGFLAVAFTLGALLYGFLRSQPILEHTSLMFIGIPAILAIVIALAPRSESITGSILRGITIALLLIAPLLGEGYLCILFAAPIFYIVGLIVGLSADRMRDKRNRVLASVLVLLVPMSLEGVVPQLTHDRTNTVEVTRIVNASTADITAALSQSPRITDTLPRFLRIGFPRPLAAYGSGLARNDTRTIHFSGAEGDPEGDLVLRVTETSATHIHFASVSDTSKLTQWIRWQSSDVTLTPLDAAHTRVTWRITYDRQLDPFWYFTPWEQLAVHQAAAYLITANATPHP